MYGASKIIFHNSAPTQNNDMGPGGGEKGGRIVAAGMPEEIADSTESLTGRHIQLMRTGLK